jgi:peptidase E
LFRKNIPDKNLEFTFAKRENFIEQIKEADAVYIHGGDTDELFADLKKYPNFLEEIQKKKLVIGTSAGAYIWAKYSLSSSEENQITERFGILPIKVTAHFQEENRSIFEKKFKQIDPEEKYENVFLRDCEAREFND